MRVRINGVERQAPEGVTLLGLIETVGLRPGRVAVELNGRVVARAEFERRPVHEGDVLEIVQFVGGG